MEPGVLGRHRRPGGGGRTPAGAGSRRRPALTTRRTGRLRSAVNLSSLEFAGSPGLEPGLQKEVGALPRSPAVPRVPTRGRPAHAGGSSGEARPQKCSRKSRLSLASQTHLQALAASLPSDFQSEPAREAAWGACP